MSSGLSIIIILFLSYLVGSVPTSIIIGKILKGIDIREHGSGNAGGTNVFRVLGWKPALIVVIFDVFKGWLPTYYFATNLVGNTIPIDTGVLQIMCGFAAVLGHTYTIFAGFKGGKGIGTLAGMLLALYPIAFPFCLIVFIITLITTGYVSLGSMFAAASRPIFLLIFPLLGIEASSLSLIVFSLLIPWFTIFTHRSNIIRLRNGNENRFEKAMIFRRKTDR
jgi:glycerol-3-phosphate acyltransferase PlsY